MGTSTYIHLGTPHRIEAVDLPNERTDVLRLADEGVDIALFLGRSDEHRAENALALIEALQEMRSRALRRMALRESADPITASKAADDEEPAGDNPWASAYGADESPTYRRDMADAGLSAKVRA